MQIPVKIGVIGDFNDNNYPINLFTCESNG